MSRELYKKQTWANLPDESTPLSAERLTHLEEGIYENSNNKALKEIYGDNNVSLGRKTGTTVGENSVAAGFDVEASGEYSCAEGYGTAASYLGAHAEGYGTIASGHSSHAEGNRTKAEGDYSHAEGNETVSNGGYGSHSEGQNTEAGGQASHSEGMSCVASGVGCHAEGYKTTSKDTFTHAEGYETVSGKTGSHAEGGYTSANANFCHAEGYQTKAASEYQHVQGKFNIEDTEKAYAHIIGNGTDEDNRANAHTVDWNGNAWYAGDVANGNGVSLDGLKTRIDEMETGGTSGTTDYVELENKPQINGVELLGNKTTSDLGITAESVGADAAGSASTALSDAKEYTNAKIDDLVNGAPSTLDTLKEISEALEESGEAVEAINQAIGNKLDKTGDSKDNTVTFTQESERSNIASNEKHSTIFGKIAKWFSDLKTVAFSGSYNDLSNKPNIPTKVSELENDSGYATDEELKKTTELVAINKQTLGYGKKNLLKNTAVTHTHNGVTFTVNNDGSITANGTVTATPASIAISGDIGLEKGKSYILSGSPNNSNCFVKLSTTIDGNANATYKEVSSARERLFTHDGTKINAVSVLVRNVGTTIDNLTFYPMIRSADIEDGTYEPYVDDVDTRLDKIDNSILNTLEEIEANTDPDMIASALAVKELYNLVKNK